MKERDMGSPLEELQIVGAQQCVSDALTERWTRDSSKIKGAGGVEAAGKTGKRSDIRPGSGRAGREQQVAR